MLYLYCTTTPLLILASDHSMPSTMQSWYKLKMDDEKNIQNIMRKERYHQYQVDYAKWNLKMHEQ